MYTKFASLSFALGGIPAQALHTDLETLVQAGLLLLVSALCSLMVTLPRAT
jgi:hypothetical protein